MEKAPNVFRVSRKGLNPRPHCLECLNLLILLQVFFQKLVSDNMTKFGFYWLIYIWANIEKSFEKVKRGLCPNINYIKDSERD